MCCRWSHPSRIQRPNNRWKRESDVFVFGLKVWKQAFDVLVSGCEYESLTNSLFAQLTGAVWMTVASSDPNNYKNDFLVAGVNFLRLVHCQSGFKCSSESGKIWYYQLVTFLVSLNLTFSYLRKFPALGKTTCSSWTWCVELERAPSVICIPVHCSLLLSTCSPNARIRKFSFITLKKLVTAVLTCPSL